MSATFKHVPPRRPTVMSIALLIAATVFGQSAGSHADELNLKPILTPKRAETKEEIEKVNAILALGSQQHENRIRQATDSVQRSEKEIKEHIVGYIKGELERNQERLKQVSALKGPFVPALADLQVGNIGRLCGAMRVLQIVDDENMLVEYVGGASPQNCWVKGFATKGLVDGDDIFPLIDLLVNVSGTKRYNSTLGATKTVLLVEPFNLDVFAPPIEASRLPIEAGRKPSNPEAKVTDTTRWRRPAEAATMPKDDSSDGSVVLGALAIASMGIAVGVYFYISSRKMARSQRGAIGRQSRER